MSENPCLSGRLIQGGAVQAIAAVRLLQLEENNQYQAQFIEFDTAGSTQVISGLTLTVVNLAEPDDENGQLPSGVEALAIDFGGQWVVNIPSESAVQSWPARVVAHVQNETYTVRRQIISGGALADDAEASNVTAANLAEKSLGSGGAVSNDSIVIVSVVKDSNDIEHYVFDHPVYAKYLN